MKGLFALFFLFPFISLAQTTYKLECHNYDIYTDLGQGLLNLETTLTVNGENNYSIEGGLFDFIINEGYDYDWTNQSVEVVKVDNYSKYKPRVYKGYAKFPSIGKNFFGSVDLLIPHSVLLEGKTDFTAVFIMSWVEDHWGDTVSASCTLK